MTTTWEFSADELNASDDSGAIIGTTKTLGVQVEDYSTKANGDYTDTIIFTAEVKAAVTLLSLTISSYTIYYVDGETWAQAISNHSTENSSWSIDGDGDVSCSGGGFLQYDFAIVAGSEIIDSSKSYTF